jgi:hypothetical protein
MFDWLGKGKPSTVAPMKQDNKTDDSASVEEEVEEEEVVDDDDDESVEYEIVEEIEEVVDDSGEVTEVVEEIVEEEVFDEGQRELSDHSEKMQKLQNPLLGKDLGLISEDEEHGGGGEVEYVEEEEVNSRHGRNLSAASSYAYSEESVHDDEEEEVFYESVRSIDGLIEEEVIESDEEDTFEEVLEEESLEDDDLVFTEEEFKQACRIDGSERTVKVGNSSRARLKNEAEEDEDDDVEAEEWGEAIAYVLRQEKAVAKMILTQEQADVMATLPRKVMRVIVDHLETVEESGDDIDWDFLLKIVQPFCEPDEYDEDDLEAEGKLTN